MSTPPSTLGPYPIERELGRGGMGVVYLGRDPRLNRPVAIKVLPDLLANNPESLARFDREAKLLASVNHPNIATIYGIEESSGHRLLVLEYIPGDTLAVRTARGPLPIDETLDVCRQIALAIEAAHEAGVIHRDLKPGNVKITPDGQVKVLDFGLAKGTTVSDAELAHSPTMTFAVTGMGVILGTAGYMSPEQARGKAVDRRTDIWSFGCVLFECLAGKQIFEGETVSDTIAKILERDPDWSALPPNTPSQVREILRRCLEKYLKKRQRDIGDVRIQLEEAVAARSTSTKMAADIAPATPRSAKPAKTFALAAALVIFGAVAGIGLWNALGPRADSSLGTSGSVHASIAVPRSIRATSAVISRDGRHVILAGTHRNPDGIDDTVPRLYARRIDDDEFKPVAGTDWTQGYVQSIDGKWLAVIAKVSAQSTQRQIVRVALDGSSPPVKIASMSDNWNTVTWLENGDFLICLRSGASYIRLPKGSDTPGAEIPLDLGAKPGIASFDKSLPNDRGVFFHVDTYTARGWSRNAWVLDLATSKAHLLAENAGSISYSPTGHIVFTRGETLMAAPFDLAKLAVTGEVTPLSRGVRIAAAWEHGRYSLSQNGTLVSAPGGLVGADRKLVTIDAKETVTPHASERRAYETFPSISPDGRRLAVVLASDTGMYETWTADQDHPVFRRTIAIPNADAFLAQWSRDGQRLAFSRYGQNKDDGVYVQNGDGSGTPRLVMGSGGGEDAVGTGSWAHDGSGIIVTKGGGGKSSVFYVPIAANGEPGTPRPLRTTSYSDLVPSISPDGRFVAFQSDESGKVEAYVAAWGPNGMQGRPLLVSSGGVNGLAWALDNRLFFATVDEKLMSVKVDAKPLLTASKPAFVLDLKKHRVATWNIFPDGRLFAIQRSEAEDDITAFNVVFNWFDELRARMATSR